MAKKLWSPRLREPCSDAVPTAEDMRCQRNTFHARKPAIKTRQRTTTSGPHHPEQPRQSSPSGS